MPISINDWEKSADHGEKEQLPYALQERVCPKDFFGDSILMGMIFR